MQVFASEALGLAFAFGNENGSTAFANAFGPSNASMPNSAAGYAAFAGAAASTIFGSSATTTIINAIDAYVTNWKNFYTSNGLPWDAHPAAAQVDLAARGAAWGDAVGLALNANVGPLLAQTTNFLEDAAQNIAVYSASLASQPTPAPVQGPATASPASTTADQVQLTGIATPSDHVTV